MILFNLILVFVLSWIPVVILGYSLGYLILKLQERSTARG